LKAGGGSNYDIGHSLDLFVMLTASFKLGKMDFQFRQKINLYLAPQFTYFSWWLRFKEARFSQQFKILLQWLKCAFL
jgi:hypothetical protein